MPFPKSEAFALVDYFGHVTAKGSKSAMLRLAKSQGGQLWRTDAPVGAKVA